MAECVFLFNCFQRASAKPIDTFIPNMRWVAGCYPSRLIIYLPCNALTIRNPWNLRSPNWARNMSWTTRIWYTSLTRENPPFTYAFYVIATWKLRRLYWTLYAAYTPLNILPSSLLRSQEVPSSIDRTRRGKLILLHALRTFVVFVHNSQGITVTTKTNGVCDVTTNVRHSLRSSR